LLPHCHAGCFEWQCVTQSKKLFRGILTANFFACLNPLKFGFCLNDLENTTCPWLTATGKSGRTAN
jgi:hypothetical protein